MTQTYQHHFSHIPGIFILSVTSYVTDGMFHVRNAPETIVTEKKTTTDPLWKKHL